MNQRSKPLCYSWSKLLWKKFG